jgi:putative membrane protein
MEVIQNVLVGFVAFLHLGFLYLEMFLWSKPQGLKIFRIDAEFASKSSALAANQGLYNGFLAAGLIWSLCATNAEQRFQLKIFFLCCVFFAGIYGAMTASKNILFLQALPALVALIFVFITKY